MKSTVVIYKTCLRSVIDSKFFKHYKSVFVFINMLHVPNFTLLRKYLRKSDLKYLTKISSDKMWIRRKVYTKRWTQLDFVRANQMLQDYHLNIDGSYRKKKKVKFDV